MDTTSTASQCFLHKNTIYYRIKKLSEMLGKDLFLPYESTKVFLAINMLINKNPS